LLKLRLHDPFLMGMRRARLAASAAYIIRRTTAANGAKAYRYRPLAAKRRRLIHASARYLASAVQPKTSPKAFKSAINAALRRPNSQRRRRGSTHGESAKISFAQPVRHGRPAAAAANTNK